MGRWVSAPHRYLFEEAVREGVTPTRTEIERRYLARQEERLPIEGLDPSSVVTCIDTHWHQHGTGPLWSEVRAAFGWDRQAGEAILRTLSRCGWISFTTKPHSLRAGRAPFEHFKYRPKPRGGDATQS